MHAGEMVANSFDLFSRAGLLPEDNHDDAITTVTHTNYKLSSSYTSLLNSNVAISVNFSTTSKTYTM